MSWQQVSLAILTIIAPLATAGIAAIVRLGNKQTATDTKVDVVSKDVLELKTDVKALMLSMAEMKGYNAGSHPAEKS